MPTFTALTLDRLLEPGAFKSVDMTDQSLKPPISKPSNSKLERRYSTPTTERKVVRPQMSPALYATPESTPLPDSPSSFPPSPYIINHKRRGPRLLKSSSNNDVPSSQKALDGGRDSGNTKDGQTKVSSLKKSASVSFTIVEPIGEEHMNGFSDDPNEKDCARNDPLKTSNVNGVYVGEIVPSNNKLGTNCGLTGSNYMSNDVPREKHTPKIVAVNAGRYTDSEEFYDPQDALSVVSNTDGEDNTGAESSAKFATPVGEFYDAWEELSSENGLQNSFRDIEAELREMRLSLLAEIENRKQTEETLNDMRNHWQQIKRQLAEVGLTFPADPTLLEDGAKLAINHLEELCEQVHIARFVSDSIGRGIAKAEIETEMEAQIESKNFEIARLLDRLHYYEAVNREMSQRNQEAVEMARQDRLKRKRRQKWVWGTIATAITLGTATLAWSYLPSGKGTSSTNNIQSADHDDVAE